MKAIIASVVAVVLALLMTAVYSLSAAEKGPWIKSIEATSILEQEKGTYTDGNIMDLTDDSWCEGEKDAGLGVSITIKLDHTRSVGELYIKNGMGIAKYWAANNRIRELKINGKTYTLKDEPGFQKVSLSGVKADELKLEIVSVYKGSRYNDTCLAEVGFSDPGSGFNRRDNYSKITGKSWAVSLGLEGDVITFIDGFLMYTDVVPCGDETCPISAAGSCKPLGASHYECRFFEQCRGTYDPKLNPHGKICTSMNDTFTLDVSTGVPVITMKGKKATLKLFD
ncbi:MAG TPA: hypothetical protein PK307_12225 [Spirochaetota bacterium]|nr:hypothetical protein [Spirochaetota bacterium]HOD15821.1 hypothetical protein [Spirochaetota bacterium]HPG52312.1 hypothetical protein [Spirochaetota bacterium]HPN13852.1 hypothetical protein [Spirochaetota bacterium]HQL82963.1 hypothetical protein [Spirochaetota bacterium]